MGWEHPPLTEVKDPLQRVWTVCSITHFDALAECECVRLCVRVCVCVCVCVYSCIRSNRVLVFSVIPWLWWGCSKRGGGNEITDLVVSATLFLFFDTFDSLYSSFIFLSRDHETAFFLPPHHTPPFLFFCLLCKQFRCVDGAFYAYAYTCMYVIAVLS